MINAAVRDKGKTVMGHVKERKLQLFGHICRLSVDRLVKIVMMGMVGDSKLQPRPPWRRSDDITEWCNWIFPEGVGLTESRHE